MDDQGRPTMDDRQLHGGRWSVVSGRSSALSYFCRIFVASRVYIYYYNAGSRRSMPQSILSSGEVALSRHGTAYRRVRRDGAAPFDTGFSSAAASLRPYSGCYGCPLDRLCVVILSRHSSLVTRYARPKEGIMNR